MPVVNKHFDSGAKRDAFKLWRAKVPQRAIMKRMEMSKSTLKKVLAFAKANSSHTFHCVQELAITHQQVFCFVRLARAFKKNRWTTVN
jgi:hypothetical protein